MNWTEVIHKPNPYKTSIFYTHLNDDKTIIYKTPKPNRLGMSIIISLKKSDNYEKYKNFIENKVHGDTISKYIINGYDVETNGSYKSRYINGVRLDSIDKNTDKIILSKIIKQCDKLTEDLNKYNAKNILGGDWALHNLVYSLKDDIIYNIDLEGFFTCQKLPSWGSISIINKWLNNVVTECKIIKNRQNRQTKIVLPFVKAFINKIDTSVKLEKTLISTIHNKENTGIYVGVEPRDLYPYDKNYDLIIDCENNAIKYKNNNNKYYSACFGAISYYLRDFSNQNWNVLLKPLKDIYNQENKKFFCDYLFTNKTYRNGVKRYKFYNILNKKKSVNNSNNGKRMSLNMYTDAVHCHRPYRFSIAFENDIVDNYVTEKIIGSFLAGCIPIYDGTDYIYKYFNKDSFINAKDFDTLEDLANYVIKVDNDKELYNKYINASPTTMEKLQKLFWWEDICKTDQVKLVHSEIKVANSLNNSLTNTLNIIKYTKKSGKAYSGTHEKIGYHSIMLGDTYYRGQRDCYKRMTYIKNEIDLVGKNILDIGCCVGGMLYPISNIIKSGVGIDYNYRNINSCNKITKYNKMSNLSFFMFESYFPMLASFNLT